jgi:hypothetical protein
MRFINLLILFLILVGCKKKNSVFTADDSALQHGLLVLNEGLFNLNNASLSWIDLTTTKVTDDFFMQQTSRKLGDTGNDMLRYGDKIYVVVNVSSTIEVIHAKNGKSLKQISMQENGIAKQPRNLAYYGGNIFVSCFDGYVDVLDTSSLTLTKRIKVGDNPEQLLVIKNNLYVSNSGGLNASLDSTISVINCNSLQEEKKINVGKNPGKLVTYNDSTLYVHIRGNYASIPAQLKKVSLSNPQMVTTFDFPISGIEIMGNKLLIHEGNQVSVFDFLTEKVESQYFLMSNSIKTLYRLQYIEKLNQLLVFDANSYTNTGYIHFFDKTGKFIQKIHVGLNPNSVIYYE